MAKETNLRKFAFTKSAEGFVEYIGLVVEETQDRFTLDLFDCILLVTAGIVQTSGELREFLKADCSVYRDIDSMMHAYDCLQVRRRIMLRGESLAFGK